MGNKLNAVMYTDGSCLPPRGSYGGGCHGYLYDESCFRKNADKPNHYTITDKGYLEKHELDAMSLGSNPPKEVKPKLYYNAIYPYGVEGTNNKAELRAIISTITVLESEHDIESILFLTDSTYVIGVFTKVKQDLDKRKWLDDIRPNLDLWVLLADTLMTCNADVSIGKVAAHGTAVGNNVADRLAFVARDVAGNGVTETSYKFYEGKYWKDKPTPHPMLNFKQVYFNAGIMPDVNEHIYPIMEYPTDVDHGKKSAEPIFGLTVTSVGDVMIDSLINFYKEKTKGEQFLTVINLKILYTQECLKMTELLGTDAFTYDSYRLKLLDEKDIAVPIRPPGNAQATLAKTLTMYRLLQHYQKHGFCDDNIIATIDITDQLYDVNPKGKFVFKFDQKVVGPEVHFTLDESEYDITLTYGKDILTRNQMKKLEADKPKVCLLVKRSAKNVLEYYVIIDTENYSGIYGNFYINKIFI